MKMYYFYNKIEDNKYHVETRWSLRPFSAEANTSKYNSQNTSCIAALQHSKITACKPAFIMTLNYQMLNNGQYTLLKNKYKSLEKTAVTECFTGKYLCSSHHVTPPPQTLTGSPQGRSGVH